jgi:hypothetical protein
MELSERLSNARQEPEARTLDAFAELKNRVHLAVISDLGPQLYNADVDDIALHRLVVADIRNRLARETGIAVADRERLIKEIADDALGHGPIEPLLADCARRRSSSRTSTTFAGSSTRSSRSSGAASTSRRRWSTPASPTAAVSTRFCRRCRCRDRF